MYYYANIDLETGVCVMVEECEEPWYDGMDGYIPLDGYYKDYEVRMKYVNGEWVESLPEETIGHSYRGEIVAVSNEWLDVALNNKADIDHTHEGYAAIGHTHSEYASSDDLQVLEDIIATKADSNHTHTGYASSNHSHDGYVSQTDFDALELEVDGKANATHSHSNYSETTHDHDSDYASVNHNHDENYSAIGHTHSNYATVTSVSELSDVVSGKANASTLNSHTSNTEIHVTDSERETWNAKSNFSGNYNDLTNKPSIPSISGLATVDYVDEKVDAIDIPSALSELITDSTHRVVTDAEKAAWNAKSNFSGSYNDLTNKPSIPSISGLATETYVDEAVSIKANSSHTHTQSDVTGLSTALNGKSDVGHTHDEYAPASHSHSNYITTTSFSTLESEVENKADISHGHTEYAVVGHSHSNYATAISVEELSETVSGKANSSHTHTISNVTNLQTTLDNKASVSHTHTASEVGAAASSHTHGDIYYTETEIDSLLSSKANSSHTHAIANVSGLQTALDGKANSSHGTHVSFSTTAPVMDGSASVGTATTVARSDHKHPTDTSRASQTDLDSLETVVSGKASASHTHSYAGSSSAGGAATSANKLNTNAGSATRPVYFANGIPVACTYTISKSVPSNAVFTDTTYSVVTSSTNGLMSTSDKSKLDGMVLATISEVETYLGI